MLFIHHFSQLIQNESSVFLKIQDLSDAGRTCSGIRAHLPYHVSTAKNYEICFYDEFATATGDGSGWIDNGQARNEPPHRGQQVMSRPVSRFMISAIVSFSFSG